MSKNQTKDLLRFLKPFSPEIQAKVLTLREFVWDLYPAANELIYDNYNAVAFGWSITEKLGHTFCSMAVGRSSFNVHFGFYYGSELQDPEKKLIGEGNQYRYLLVTDLKKFPKAYVKKLLAEAYTNSLKKIKDIDKVVEGKTITKSISSVKRAPKSKVKKTVKKRARKKAK